MRYLLITLLIVSATALTGCGGRFGHTPDRAFVSPRSLGTHKGLNEGNGMLYTLRGGHIDLAHVRGAADQTKTAYDRAYSSLVKGKSGFTVSPAWERITNRVEFTYPADWKERPRAQRERIAREVALRVAPAVGYNSTLYHEMLTWKGAKFFLIEPEAKSSFSWEDIYSNIVGAWVATKALEAGGDFNATFSRLLDRELEHLGVVSRSEAERITQTVEGTWYTAASLNKKNMDSHLDDDVSPCLVPGHVRGEPVTYPLPTLEGIGQYGIGVDYTIGAFFLENMELKRIAGTSDDLRPLKDFAAIMKNIQEEGVEDGLDIHK